jgi:alginate O-acetyltransferase complex protein AlgI
MLFNSYPFLFVYLPIVLAGCFILSAWRGARMAQDWLILASLSFYSAWNLAFLPLLLASIVFNFLIAKAMIGASEGRQRLCLLTAVTVDLGLLAYFKYAGYFVSTADEVFGLNWSIGAIALPLGISFYTFQQITLLVDVSQGRIHNFRFRDFLLFVTFFPHLIAGPIVHHREMMPQFETASYGFNIRNLAVGLSLFAAGLFKKAVIADSIASEVAPLFGQAAAGVHLPMLTAWAAAVGFTLQIYFDFSGYSEMALGLARMLGIKLPVNFNSPLKATNIIEFWQRWNMTLTRFLTAYIYNPLTLALTRRRLMSGRKGVAGVKTTPGAFATLIMVPTITTMFLSGLWHGAGNQFLVFGLLNGIYLVICHAWRLYRSKIWPDYERIQPFTAPIGLALTFTAVSISMLYFRSDSVGTATNIVAGMFGFNGLLLPEGLERRLPFVAHLLVGLGAHLQPGRLLDAINLWILVPFAIVLLSPNVLEIMRDTEPAITSLAVPRDAGWLRRLQDRLRWRPSRGWAMLTGAVAATGVLTLTKVTEFLYWQF